MIQPLHPPDSLHLQAAQGWLNFATRVEADTEWDRITPLQAHPAVGKGRQIH